MFFDKRKTHPAKVCFLVQQGALTAPLSSCSHAIHGIGLCLRLQAHHVAIPVSSAHESTHDQVSQNSEAEPAQDHTEYQQ